MKRKQITELLLQTLETEMGGVQIYENALKCAIHDDLKKEWTEYLEQTQNHVAIATRVCEAMGIDPRQQTPRRLVVHHIGQSLLQAMKAALDSGEPEAAQLVATECVVEAETKDHLNWELIGHLAKGMKGLEAQTLRDAFEEVEEQQDEHLYHTTGWCRELWIDSLGMPAVLPPPEEEKDVTTAIGTVRAKMARKELL